MTKDRFTTPQTLVFFIDPIEGSSYPVSETGYAMVYRAWRRAVERGDEVFVVYPRPPAAPATNPFARITEPRVLAHPVLRFRDSPYDFYRSQRASYDPRAHVGSEPCHEQGAPVEIDLRDVDAVVFRHETGDPVERQLLLQTLERIQEHTLVYLSPTLALDPKLGSKILPAMLDPARTPRTFRSDRCDGGCAGATIREKATAALVFIRECLGNPASVVVKPLHTDNGVGIRIMGDHPVDGSSAPADAAMLTEMLETFGDIAVQEYLPSVRRPADLMDTPLEHVPEDRRDFGEIRFVLVDGKVPRSADGEPIRVARRVPANDSIVADSGISHPSSLSPEELAFVEEVGQRYLELGIHFGGGDLIRTADPQRPFLFTDAAQSVCGHAVVTGALNREPYLIVDRVLDSIERQLDLHRASRALRTAVGAG